MRLYNYLIYCFFVTISQSLLAQENTDFFAKALDYKKREQYNEALKWVLKAKEVNPQDKNIFYELAEIQYLRKAFFEAIPLYEEIIKEDSKNIIFLCRLSEMYSMSPQKQKAIQYAEQIAKMKPSDGTTNKVLGRTYYELKHYPKAIEYYLLAEKNLKSDKDIPYKLAFCYRNLQRYGDALGWYIKASDMDSDNANKLYEVANAAYDAGNYELANTYYEKAEKNGMYKSKGFYDNWSLACVEMKDYDKAIFYLMKAKEYAPFDKDINLSIADVYMRKGSFDKSREQLDKMLEYNPIDAEVIYTKGMTYYKAGNTSKAEIYFNKAFELDPSLKSLRYTKSNF